MIDLEELQFLAQLAKNLEIGIEKLEKAHAKKDLKEFNKIKSELFEIQKKISSIIK